MDRQICGWGKSIIIIKMSPHEGLKISFGVKTFDLQASWAYSTWFRQSRQIKSVFLFNYFICHFACLLIIAHWSISSSIFDMYLEKLKYVIFTRSSLRNVRNLDETKANQCNDSMMRLREIIEVTLLITLSPESSLYKKPSKLSLHMNVKLHTSQH